jgi:hypothetical protein
VLIHEVVPTGELSLDQVRVAYLQCPTGTRDTGSGCSDCGFGSFSSVPGLTACRYKFDALLRYDE